ncbi:hypothetical protein [Streptomyces sp. NPDC046727]|uniref:hypothetical protein n=1 Tax=Streptomyces sp. NPDC046727 TaxID=3155373 RepID=UPI0033D6CEA0
MGVFARLLGRSKATPGTSVEEAQAGTEPEGAEAARTEEAESAEAREAGATKAAKAADEAGDGREDGREDVSVRSDAGTDETSDDAGIPRQPSAGEAADSEAGEGART